MAVVGAVAMLLVAASAFAQGNFSGKWAPDADKNPAPAAGAGGGGGRGGGAPGPMTITQTATTLTIERETPNGPQKQEYTLDGAEHTMPMGQVEAKVTAKSAGGTITITRTVDRGQGPATTTIVYSMEGANLVVATTNPGRGGGEPTTNKVYYKKAM
ncbi:MAG: hypothetical protein EPO35_00785 [Acidobacteria bacterium]|nr:MAG: hypothetical protein EPO35_00785 [Acidobacteriota bacterium]